LLPPRRRDRRVFRRGYWLALWDAVVATRRHGCCSSRNGHRACERPRALTGGADFNLLSTLRNTLRPSQSSLCLEFYEGFFREHQYDMSNQSLSGWLAIRQGLIITLIFGCILGPRFTRYTQGARTWCCGEPWSRCWIRVPGGSWSHLPGAGIQSVLSLPTAPQAGDSSMAGQWRTRAQVYEFDDPKQTPGERAVSGLFRRGGSVYNETHESRTPGRIRRAWPEIGHILNHVYKVHGTDFPHRDGGFAWCNGARKG